MNRRMRLAAAVWWCALWCAPTARAVDWAAFRPQGYVSDFAGVVDAGGKRQLDAYCAAVEQATGAQIALVTIASLQREPIEDVTHAIFRAWNLDQKPQKNAVIWLVAVENRRDWMEAGPGLATILTSGEMAAILRQARPALARQQYALALMAAADEMGSRIAAAQRKTIAVRLPRRERRSLAESIPWLLAAGALLLFFWLFRVLGPPARHIRPAGGGFGGGETGGW
ncbi:MAG: TPM domain-containing protein [Bryobacteraceae bacterium]|jgi:uncharacterized protein